MTPAEFFIKIRIKLATLQVLCLTGNIKSLAPNTTYYFKIRGGNHCAVGEWSDWLMAKTENSVYSYTNTDTR